MHRRATLTYLAAATAAALVSPLPASRAMAAPTSPAVVNAGVNAWVDAARAGRADMLVIGDSVTWFGGNGWDAGLNVAAGEAFGLAGTGLSVNSSSTGEGEGFAVFGHWNGWDTNLSAVPAAYRDHAWVKTSPSDAAVSSGPGPTAMFGWGVEAVNGTLPTNAAYDFHVWTASTGGTLGAFRRSGATFARLGTLPSVATTGYQHTTFSFPANANADRQEIFLEDARDTSVLYSRLTRPGVNGVTVSSWGYGGRSTLDFYNDLYTAMPATGRQGVLRAMVEGGTGKLNVVIAEGFNDRNETSPSVNGVATGNSPEAFRDNVSALIGAMRSDWSAAGLAPADLSFTLLGMYEIADGNDPLRAYAAELESLAQADPGLAFVDLYQLAPSYQQAVAQQYITDGLHLERSGALVYGESIIGAIVPEPGMLALSAVAFTLLCGRRLRRGR